MNLRKINWPTWIGLLLSFLALLSYPFAFLGLDVTRDIRWLNLALFAIAAIFLFVGLRRAFQGGRSRLSKVASAVAAVLSAGLLVLFIFGTFIMARLPASSGAPHVGQKAPEFNLSDTNGKSLSLAELLTSSNGEQPPPKGVLLVFYRGYW